MKDRVILPYAPILVESTRSVGYSFESALADIIDNSISKRAKEIHVKYDSNDPQYVAVIDDACGMNEEELLTAMRYGSKSSNDEREEDNTLVDELHEVISHLDEPDRTIVTMKLEGYSYKEISSQLGLTEKNVSVRLVRVKDKLREEMTK